MPCYLSLLGGGRMKIIDLPWLDPDEPLSGAVTRLVQLNSVGNIAAVVTHLAGIPLIITAQAIIEAAREEPEKTLGEVAPIAPSVEVTFEASTPDNVVEGALEAEGVDYGIHRPIKPMARVFTRLEPLADELIAHVTICQCTGPREHPWFAAQVPPDRMCFCHHPIECP